MASFLEEFAETLSNFPVEMHKHLNEIRKLDIECHKKALKCDEKMKEFVKTHKSQSKDVMINFHKEIMVCFLSYFIFIFLQ